MIGAGIEEELRRHLALLPLIRQRQVLDFARSLSTVEPGGLKGSSLLPFAGTIPPDELARMQEVIDADCEQVDVRDW